MLDQASMRLMLLWARATRLPTVMVSTARTASTGNQAQASCGCISSAKRTRMAKPAALTAVAMKPVT